MTHRHKTGCRMQERRAKDYIKKGRSEKELQECNACLKGDFKTVVIKFSFKCTTVKLGILAMGSANENPSDGRFFLGSIDESMAKNFQRRKPGLRGPFLLRTEKN